MRPAARPGGSRGPRRFPPDPDVLQVRAAAEDAGDAAQDHGAHGGVAGEQEAGLAEVAGRFDVERVEALGAIDREQSDGAVALHADVRHGRPPAAAIGEREIRRRALEAFARRESARHQGDGSRQERPPGRLEHPLLVREGVGVDRVGEPATAQVGDERRHRKGPRAQQDRSLVQPLGHDVRGRPRLRLSRPDRVAHGAQARVERAPVGSRARQIAAVDVDDPAGEGLEHRLASAGRDSSRGGPGPAARHRGARRFRGRTRAPQIEVGRAAGGRRRNGSSSRARGPGRPRAPTAPEGRRRRRGSRRGPTPVGGGLRGDSRAPGSAGSRGRRRAGGASAYARQRLALGLGEEAPSETGVENDRAGALGDARADDGGVACRAGARAAPRARARPSPAARRGPPCPRWRRGADRCRAGRPPRAPRTSPGRRGSSSRMPTRLFSAISWRAEERPPRVGSFMATIAPSAADERRADQAVDRARRRRRASPSSSRAWRAAMIARPWSPMRAGHEDAVARPRGPQSGMTRSVRREAGRVEDDPVDLAAAHHLRVARDDRGAGLAAGVADRGLDALEVGAGEALLDDRGAGQGQDLGRAHHGEVVDGAARPRAGRCRRRERRRDGRRGSRS